MRYMVRYGREVEVEVNGRNELWPVDDIAAENMLSVRKTAEMLGGMEIAGELAGEGGGKARELLRVYARRIGLEIGSDTITVCGMSEDMQVLLYDGNVFVGEIDADSFDGFLGNIHRAILDAE